ncbi:MAG: hypothetical protein WBM69_24675 [Desulfobacterales bacterium]
MCEQPVPKITDKDVKRIALRDFGEDRLFKVLSILSKFGKQDWNEPNPRIQLAILKLASGDIIKLADATKAAIEDFRDILSEAEYPRYSREIGFKEVAQDFKRAVIDDDWKQYREWLEKE